MIDQLKRYIEMVAVSAALLFFLPAQAQTIVNTPFKLPEGQLMPVYQHFKDWTVGCDNLGRCTARYSYKDMSEGNIDVGFRIERDAGLKGAVRLTLTNYNPDNKLEYDEKPLVFEGKFSLLLNEDDSDTNLISEDLKTVLAFIDQIKNADRITYADDYDWTLISLDGLTASLLFIDEQQGRLNTKTAFIKRGNLADSSTPQAPTPILYRPPPALEGPLSQEDGAALVKAVRSAQQAELEKHECDFNYSYDRALRLNADEAIVILTCQLSAYQGSSLVFIAPLKQPEEAYKLMLALPATSEFAGLVDNSFISPYFNEKDRSFSFSERGRSANDCGASASWSYEDGQFQLARWIFHNRCSGEAMGDWMMLWRTVEQTKE